MGAKNENYVDNLNSSLTGSVKPLFLRILSGIYQSCVIIITFIAIVIMNTKVLDSKMDELQHMIHPESFLTIQKPAPYVKKDKIDTITVEEFQENNQAVTNIAKILANIQVGDKHPNMSMSTSQIASILPSDSNTCQPDKYDVALRKMGEEKTNYECCYRDPNYPLENVGRPFRLGEKATAVYEEYIKGPYITHDQMERLPQHRWPRPVTAFSDNHYRFGAGLRGFSQVRMFCVY